MTTTANQKEQTSLFVTGLNEEVDEDVLTKHIMSIDRTIKIRSIRILRNFQTMKSRGFGIIELTSKEDGTPSSIHFVR